MMAAYRNGVYPRVNTLDEAYDFAANFVEPTKANNGNKVIFTAVGSKLERNISQSKSQTMQIKNKNHRKTSEMVEVAQIRREVADLDLTFRAKVVEPQTIGLKTVQIQ
jgi:hypothetical protein